MIWLQSGSERFFCKVRQQERQNGKLRERGHRLDSEWQWLVPLQGILHQSKLAEVAGSYRASTEVNRRKWRTVARNWVWSEVKAVKVPFSQIFSTTSKRFVVVVVYLVFFCLFCLIYQELIEVLQGESYWESMLEIFF